MRTTKLADDVLDIAQIAPDLEAAKSFPFNNAYSEFVLGDWRSCMLWNGSGETDDATLSSDQRPARITPLGKSMPYLRSIVEQTFELDQLRFARLARMMPGTVLVPHRDFLELSERLVRIHLPLATDRLCLNAEEHQVFHMAVGEAWFLDANRLHSAWSGWDRPRVHLILDFAATKELASVLRGRLQSTPQIPADAIVARPSLTASEQAAIAALGELIDRFNYREILGILIRKTFTRDMPLQMVFDELESFARQSRDPALKDVIAEQRSYFTVERR